MTQPLDAQSADDQLPLAGLRVIVTRPAHQADKLCSLLRRAGAEAVRFPTLAIEALDSAADQQRIKSTFMELDQYQWVIFISANAAELACRSIDEYWPQLPLGIHWVAIGAATARVLNAHQIPTFSSTDETNADNLSMDSEALLALPQLADMQHQKVLICRGEGGREHLATELNARGAAVDYVELYRRNCPDYNAHLIDNIIYTSLPAAIFINSITALSHFDQLCQKGNNKNLLEIRQQHLIVPSARVAEHAQQLGYLRVTTADNATDEAMLNALLHLKHG